MGSGLMAEEQVLPHAGAEVAGGRPGPSRGGCWRSLLAYATCVVVTAVVSVAATTWVLSSTRSGEWVQVYREDFDVAAPVGSFPGAAYGERATVYPDGWSDTSGRGQYTPSQVLSVVDGVLQWDMHTVDGIPRGAAVLPTLPTYGQTYGRYSVRFRADPVAGYGLAFLLWPDSEKWPRDGEIDFPEGELDGPVKAVAHHASERGTIDGFPPTTTFDDWHIATTEWRPDEITFLMDGEVVGRSTTDVPSRSMHWVLQTGTDGDALPDPAARTRIQVDWLEAEALR